LEKKMQGLKSVCDEGSGSHAALVAGDHDSTASIEDKKEGMDSVAVEELPYVEMEGSGGKSRKRLKS
jgi:hypothetical protein